MTNKADKPEVIDSACLEAFDHLYAYLNGEIKDEETLARIEHHLGHCKSCYSRAEMERQINERLKQAGKDKTPESLQKRIRGLIDDL
jgi:anti-sigma factor (TIGR02949 family)